MNAPELAMWRLIRQRRRRLRLRSYQRRLIHHTRQPRCSATRSVAVQAERLDAVAAADEHLSDELRREEAVLDDSRRGREERREVSRIADRPTVVGDQSTVGT